MSDQRIRDLERRWRASGLPADHAALLLDYVRTGRLNEARLQVAAYCGHAGAAAALGIPVGRSKVPGLLSEWVLGTPRTEIGAELVVRAVVLAACGTLRSLRRRDGVLIRHLEHAAEWCDCPCEKHQRQAAWGVDPEAAIGSADLALRCATSQRSLQAETQAAVLETGELTSMSHFTARAGHGRRIAFGGLGRSWRPKVPLV